MSEGINYFVEDRGSRILVRNSVYGLQELSKKCSPKGATVVVFREGVGHQTILIDMFDKLKPDSIFPEYQ